ncbi:MAG: hypothetical protein GY913_26650 [Proteobacteria bacterium]|nr:hypothetical protein [Pseudomonadota bacterium]MCP4920496.1 hypothetical protein [Pseudomonadota bacterium]
MAVTIEPAFPALSFNRITGLNPTPDGSEWFLLTQDGQLEAFENTDDVSETRTVLDLTGVVTLESELGLLGFAFSPTWDDSGVAYVSYTTGGSEGTITSHISRFTSTDGGQTLDPASEESILTLEQTGTNHNGGKLAFHPDGSLFIGFGDGGGSGRKYTAADPTTWFGSMLRIQVEDTGAYTVPADNPFDNEVWAYGLRNPWSWHIDDETGDVWVGDVGWLTWEELNRIEKGGFYGWPYYEADLCSKDEECLEYGQRRPLAVYGHDEGVSITGGPVYRGAGIPTLQGATLFTDFSTGKLWAHRDGETVVLSETTGLRVAHIAVGRDGEVLLPEFTYGGGGGLYALVASETTEDTFPSTLAETGCDETVRIPYEVAVPFWSDDVDKTRWVALPDDETIDATTWSLPIGTVLGKEFLNETGLLETRLLVRHDSGEWAGYAFSGDGALLPGALVLDDGYRVPSRGDCLRCHTDGPLAWRTDQLAVEREGISQLDWLDAIDVTRGAPRDDGTLEPGSARAWLDVNCAMCHDGEANGLTMDLRNTTALSEMAACDVEPQGWDLDVDGALRVAPGSAETSLVHLRLVADGAHRMPPVGPVTLDTVGAERVADWIDALEDCSD